MKHIYLLAVAFFSVVICVAQAGTLDSTFSQVGFFRANDKSFSRGAIQPDNKLVIAGTGFPSRLGNFEIYRYTAEGLEDASFGTGGISRVIIGGNTAVRGVLIQQDGKIIILGESRVAWNTGSGVTATTAIVRLNANGTIDETFGNHGIVKIIFGNATSVYAGEISMALQQDGKILVSGPDYTISESTFSLWRLNTNGSTDNSFGTDGRVIRAISDHAFSTLVLVQPDGKIVYFGETTITDRFVARYLPGGTPDVSFNGTGIIYVYAGIGRFFDAVIQPDGKLLAVIDVGNNFHLQRINTNGTPDNGFGINGLVESKFALPVHTNSVHLQENGKIIVGGMFPFIPGAFGYGMALARYLPSGTLDSTFGSSGITMKSFGYSTGGLVFGVTAQRIFMLGSGFENTVNYLNYGVIAAFKIESAPTSCGKNNVQICHKGKDLCIASAAVAAHLAHGDRLGSCTASVRVKPKRYEGNASVLDEERSRTFSISNSPNPFHSTTRLQYEIPVDGSVIIKVYNSLGKEITTLANSRRFAGIYTVDFSAGSLSNGVYYYKISHVTDQHDVFIKSGKMIIAK